jgi:predicted O-methyltransferase YrrM
MPERLAQVLKLTPKLFSQTEGHISEKEARFLTLLPFLDLPGEILEIGSYKGKSTIILAKAAQIAGMKKIYACDPLFQSSSTDPKDYPEDKLPEIFQSNLDKNGVKDFIRFYKVKSEELSRTWDLPIKALWIDGDHTLEGASLDFHLFKKHLVPGAVVAYHDVLHDFAGPMDVFIKEMLLSGEFGDCGIWGSIGWAQYIKGMSPNKEQNNRKKMLYRKLQKLNGVTLKRSALHKFVYNFRRSLVPHKEENSHEWLHKRNHWENGIH